MYPLLRICRSQNRKFQEKLIGKDAVQWLSAKRTKHLELSSQSPEYIHDLKRVIQNELREKKNRKKRQWRSPSGSLALFHDLFLLSPFASVCYLTNTNCHCSPYPGRKPNSSGTPRPAGGLRA